MKTKPTPRQHLEENWRRNENQTDGDILILLAGGTLIHPTPAYFTCDAPFVFCLSINRLLERRVDVTVSTRRGAVLSVAINWKCFADYHTFTTCRDVVARFKEECFVCFEKVLHKDAQSAPIWTTTKQTFTNAQSFRPF